MPFELDKKNALYKLYNIDKSKKGSIDEGIVKLIELINKNNDYYTTSSCSGRMMLMSPGISKDDTKWLFASHNSVLLPELKNVDLPSGMAVFVMESFILHVCTKDQDKATRLLELAQRCGLKHSGIITLGKKIIVELIGNERIEMPIAVDGEWLMDDESLSYILEEANKKLMQNNEKIKQLQNTLSNLLTNSLQ